MWRIEKRNIFQPLERFKWFMGWDLKAYVTVQGEDKVVVIDTNSLEIISRIPTGNIPFWISVSGNT